MSFETIEIKMAAVSAKRSITHSTLPFYRESLNCHQILKLTSLGLLDFYLQEVEDDLEINLFSSFAFRDVFRQEHPASN